MSDNTSRVNFRFARLTPRQRVYLQDVGAAALLALVLWAFTLLTL